MSDIPPWAITIGVTAAGGLLVYLMKFVFEKHILGRIDSILIKLEEQDEHSEMRWKEVIAEVRNLNATTVDHAQRLALGNQAFQSLRDQVVELKQEIEWLKENVRGRKTSR